MTRWTVHLPWASLLVVLVVLSRAETGATADDADKLKPEFPDTTKVAVVDVVQIFKTSKNLKDQMDKMKLKVEEAEAKVNNQQEELKKLTERQKDESTPAEKRADIEKKLTERQSLLQAEVAIHKQQFFREEGAIYFQMTTVIDRAIEAYSKQRGLHLVLRMNGEKSDPNDRNKIMQGITKSICYFDPKLDITQEIIKALNVD
jgi:Skp family chaperone for outer membrane proteins